MDSTSAEALHVFTSYCKRVLKKEQQLLLSLPATFATFIGIAVDRLLIDGHCTRLQWPESELFEPLIDQANAQWVEELRRLRD